MLRAVGRYLKQLRVAYLLLVLAGLLAVGLLAFARGPTRPRHPTPLTIARPGPRACATVVVSDSQPIVVTVQRRAVAVMPVSVAATRGASARGPRGDVRTTATATARVNLSQTARASARLSLRLRASVRISACAPGRTAAAAQARARMLARRGGDERVQRLLRSRAPGAVAGAERRLGPQVSARALALARQELAARATVARASALSAAAAAAQRAAARQARREARAGASAG